MSNETTELRQSEPYLHLYNPPAIAMSKTSGFRLNDCN